MPYKEKRKQASRDSMEKKRKGLTMGVNIEGINKERVNTYPRIIYDLTDPLKRRKLEKITQSLKEFKVSDKVYYGIGDFDMIGDLLDATH